MEIYNKRAVYKIVYYYVIRMKIANSYNYCIWPFVGIKCLAVKLRVFLSEGLLLSFWCAKLILKYNIKNDYCHKAPLIIVVLTISISFFYLNKESFQLRNILNPNWNCNFIYRAYKPCRSLKDTCTIDADNVQHHTMVQP